MRIVCVALILCACSKENKQQTTEKEEASANDGRVLEMHALEDWQLTKPAAASDQGLLHIHDMYYQDKKVSSLVEKWGKTKDVRYLIIVAFESPSDTLMRFEIISAHGNKQTIELRSRIGKQTHRKVVVARDGAATFTDLRSNNVSQSSVPQDCRNLLTAVPHFLAPSKLRVGDRVRACDFNLSNDDWTKPQIRSWEVSEVSDKRFTLLAKYQGDSVYKIADGRGVIQLQTDQVKIKRRSDSTLSAVQSKELAKIAETIGQ